MTTNARSVQLLLIDGDANGLFTLKTPQCFSSPSSAASFVLGGFVDERTEWLTESGQKFEELDQLEKEDA